MEDMLLTMTSLMDHRCMVLLLHFGLVVEERLLLMVLKRTCPRAYCTFVVLNISAVFMLESLNHIWYLWILKFNSVLCIHLMNKHKLYYIHFGKVKGYWVKMTGIINLIFLQDFRRCCFDLFFTTGLMLTVQPSRRWWPLSTSYLLRTTTSQRMKHWSVTVIIKLISRNSKLVNSLCNIKTKSGRLNGTNSLVKMCI